MKYSAILIFQFLLINIFCNRFLIEHENNDKKEKNANNAFPKSGIKSFLENENTQEFVDSILKREGNGYFWVFIFLFALAFILSGFYICCDKIKDMTNKRRIRSDTIEKNK
jgi:hypothetical protein